MKRIICISVVLALILATLIGCSEYIVLDDSADTGESISPEQMVEISKEMQQTEAAPIDSSTKESTSVEPVQTEAATVAPSVIESSIVEPVQTEVPAVESSTVESSVVKPVQTVATTVESSAIESSFVDFVPTDTVAPSDGSTETTIPSTTTADAGNETPIVPMETNHTSSPDDTIQSSNGKVVYWTPGGSVWHVTESCSSLSRSKEIVKGNEAEAQAAGKERVCKRCGG